MKKLYIRTFLLACTLTAALPVSAQWRVGLQAGYSHNTRTISANYDYDRRNESIGGFTIAVPVEYSFYDWLGVRAELAFVQKGHKTHRTEYLSKIFTDTRDNYLQLPVMAHFSFGGLRLRGFVHAGGYIGYWLSSHAKGTTFRYFGNDEGNSEELITPDDRYDFDESIPFDKRRDNRFEAGMMGGAGISYKLTQRIDLQAEVRYYYSLTDNQKKYMKFQAPHYNNTLTAQIGCMITLGKIKSNKSR